MSNKLAREQQIIDAVIRFRAVLAGDEVPNVRAFVQTCNPDIQEEVQEYIEICLVMEEPDEPIVLAPKEQALADRVAPRTWEKFQQRWRGDRDSTR